jgi:hypothetical protein
MEENKMTNSLMILGYKIPKSQAYKKRKKKMNYGSCECGPTPNYVPGAKFCHICGRSIVPYTDIVESLIIKEIENDKPSFLKSFFNYEVFIDYYIDYIYIGNILSHVDNDEPTGGIKLVSYSEEFAIDDELTFEKITYRHRDLREKLNDYDFDKEFGLWLVMFDI